MPYSLLRRWIDEEKMAGAPNPQQAVLSTATAAAIPHSRVVAIREITDSLLFFTQQGTRKVTELQHNPAVSLTFWLELYQREIIIEGSIEALSHAENEGYWKNYSREAQLRFSAYAATSMQPIASKEILESKKTALQQQYQNTDIPFNPLYCGFRIKPHKMIFYAYRLDELSDVIEYTLRHHSWGKQLLSP